METPSTIPKTQKAWRVVRWGHPSTALELHTDTAVVTNLAKGEVLVKVQAAALNPAGYKLMQLLPNTLVHRPHTAENDFTGVIVSQNGTEYAVGDEVFGWMPNTIQQRSSQGALCSYLCVPATYITRRPSTLTPIEAAGGGLAGLTAWQGLFNCGKIEAGQDVFINGGSSSIGSNAIQIAKAMQCRVVTTTSGPNVELVKSLGADEVIDYTTVGKLHEYFANRGTTYDLFFDVIGTTTDLFTYCEPYLRPKGIFVSAGPKVETLSDVPSGVWGMAKNALRPSWLGAPNRRYKIIHLKYAKEDLEGLRELMEQGKLKPLVDSVHSFDNALQAYERIMTSRARGKVVVTAPE